MHSNAPSNNRQNPSSYDEVVQLLEEGRISVAEAFRLLRDVEAGAPRPVPRNPLPQPAQPDQQATLEQIMAELESLIGLTKVKRLVRELQAFIQIQKCREAQHLATEPMVLHMIFKGNPGTGKTTVARLMGRIFKELGVLPKGQLTEIERADLVGEYIGHTAQKTREQIRRALGGILFIDEAYSLARGGEKDFGKESIDALVKSMEDYRDQLIIVLAGYQREMDWFLETNPGLRSRFPIILEFDDYTIDELLQIAELMLRRRQYKLSAEAKDKLGHLLLKYYRYEPENFGNARLVRNIIERAIRKQAVRLVRAKKGLSREMLMLIIPDDIVEDD
ncbi:MAG: AAA family ATPase [Bacillota bacterium]|jgi:stage V sporulation protein K